MVLVVKNSPANAGDWRDTSLIPGSGRSPRGGQGSPLQHSFLENPTDRGAWWAAVHSVTESDTTEVAGHWHVYIRCIYGGSLGHTELEMASGLAFLHACWAPLCCAWADCWQVTGVIREGTDRVWVRGCQAAPARLPKKACHNRQKQDAQQF